MQKQRTDGIWIIDAEGKTVFANEPMTEILGTSPSAILGEDSFLYVSPEDLPAAQQLFASKQAGHSAPFHFKLRRKDGTCIWVEVQGTPMHDPSGQFKGIVGTFRVADPPNS